MAFRTTGDESRLPLRALELLALLGLALAAFGLRLEAVARDGALERGPEAGLMKSDPGLLFYLTRRVAEAPGLLPADWRADPRIAHPELVDVPADYTVGLEMLLGWSWRAFEPEGSLLEWCHRGSSLLAALAVLGVWGLARELGRARAPALVAAALYLALPASYRTAGFVLMREDLSLPLYALHLALAARAARVGSRGATCAAAATAALALATWHAMGFVLLIEGAVLLAVFLRSGSSPFERHAPWSLGCLALSWILVPAIRGGPLLALLVLVLILWLGPRLAPRRPRFATLGLSILALAVALLLARGGANYAHVGEVFLAKLRHFGRLPEDPSQLSFDARLMWQGPFATLRLVRAWELLGVASIAGAAACAAGLGSRRTTVWAASALGLAAFAAAFFAQRLVVVPALLLPPVCAWAWVAMRRRLADGGAEERPDEEPRSLTELLRASASFVTGGLLVVQLVLFQDWRSTFRLGWYGSERTTRELAEAVEAVERFVPVGEAVAGDFMSSTAVLAWTERPVLLQPKWERAEARERVRIFWDHLYHRGPKDLRRLLRDEYACRYLLVDRSALWSMVASRYSAGIAGELEQPPPGSALEALLAAPRGEQSVLPAGYHLLWTGTPAAGRVEARMRLFEL